MPKQARAYKRIQSGFIIASNKRESVRFITLTSAVGVRRMSKDWGVLVKRIRRRFGRFEYCRVSTNEGNGVIHAVYRGAYIPQRLLSSMWKQIHHSPVVDIRLVRPYKGLASYIVNQYVSCQKSSYQRCATSWEWIFRGWSGVYNRFYKGIQNSLDRRDAWESFLKGFRIKILDRGIVKYLSLLSVLHSVKTAQKTLENDFLFPTFVFGPSIPPKLHRCDKCHENSLYVRHILGVWVCQKCYPSSEYNE